MPALILHGGTGAARPKPYRDAIAAALAEIADQVWPAVVGGESALSCAVKTAQLLEDNPLFNAGLGSKLQEDGGARLSAALMDGSTSRFSGVINAERLLNPILLAEKLQTERDRVLSGTGATAHAEQLGLSLGDVRTPEAIAAWEDAVEGATGTIGAVVLDVDGRIAAATSTGGRGMERVGRVSDSATVAGNFASHAGGISCTGIGEDIVDGALAARLVCALDGGETLERATARLMQQMQDHDWKAGFIALDAAGAWSTAHTTEILYWHAVDGSGHHRFKDPENG